MRRYIVLLLATVPVVALADEKAKIAPKRIIVVKPLTKLMLKEKEVAKARAGELLTVTRISGSWYWVPTHDAWIEKADVLEVNAAIRHFSRDVAAKKSAVAYEHRARAYFAIGKYDAALSDLGQSLKLEPNRVSALVTRGLVWQAGGNIQQALGDYEHALKIDPKNTAALNNRASVLIETGNLNKALVDVTASLRIDPNQPAAINNRGELLRKSGRLREALRAFDRAIKLRSSYAAAYHNRAVLLEQTGNYARAVSDYQKAIKFDPEFAQAHNNFAWLRATCREKKYRNGTEAVKLALEANRLTAFADWNFLDTLAAAFAENGRFTDAVKYARQALVKAPKDKQAEVQSHLRRFQRGRTLAK